MPEKHGGGGEGVDAGRERNEKGKDGEKNGRREAEREYRCAYINGEYKRKIRRERREKNRSVHELWPGTNKAEGKIISATE